MFGKKLIAVCLVGALALSTCVMVSATDTTEGMKESRTMGQMEGKNQKENFGTKMTEEEMAAFEAMTDEEKAAYLEEIKAEMEASKPEAAEKPELTDEEKEAMQAEMEAKKAEREANMEEKPEMAERSEMAEHPMLDMTEEEQATFEAMTQEEKMAYLEELGIEIGQMGNQMGNQMGGMQRR